MTRTCFPRVFWGAALLLLVRCGGSSSSGNMTVKGGVGTSTQATTGINPSSLKVKMYKVGFSTSANCTNLTSFSISDSPEYTDWMTSPALGSGSLADGNYPCVVMEISDTIKFTPAETSTNNLCVSGTEVTMQVCRQAGSSTLIDGTSVTCSTSEDRVAVYISTGGSIGGENSGFSPSAPTLLSSALSVAGAKTGTFKIGALGKVGEYNTGPQGSAECSMDEPSWNFE